MIIKQPLPASAGVKEQILYEGTVVDAEVFNVHDFGGYQKYAIVRAPDARQWVKLSVVKVK